MSILDRLIPNQQEPKEELSQVLAEARACTLCAEDLPLGPNPIVRLSPKLRVLLVSQAPGSIAHRKSIPYQDPSGVRLREWLGVDEHVFYESGLFGILPMGFCYPGKMGGGDAPPRSICAPTWHPRLLATLTPPKLTILIGAYAQGAYLPDQQRGSVTENVRAYAGLLASGILALPHPSPRNNIWLRRNDWFEAEVLPVLWQAVAEAIA